MDINEEQKIAINHYKGPCMVLAGPGSGKTFVVTQRLKKLIVNKKVIPSEILVISFTRASANEMKERFIKLLKNDKIHIDDMPTFGTFHSIFYSILKDNFGYNNNSLITEQEEKEFILNVIEKDKEIDATFDNANLILNDIKSYKLSKEKEENFSPKFLSKLKFDEIYEKYKQLLFNKKKLDFHDMISLCYELLLSHCDVLAYYREKYNYILIDEFQDINKEQYDIIKLILNKSKNLFVVGDDDQSIYKFRGSRPKVVFEFKNDFPKYKLVILNKNYRCAKSIVDFSKTIIKNNKERINKKLKSERKEKGTIYINSFEDSNEENDYIIDIIRQKLNEEQNLTDIAILFRTNILSLSIIQKLKKENISFYTKDIKNDYFSHFAINDILSYLNIVNGSNNIEDFTNIINKPNRYVSRDSIGYKKCSIKDLKKYYKEKSFILKYINKFENDIYLMKDLNVALMIRYIRQEIGYEKYLLDYCKKHNIDYDEIKELLNEFEEECVRFKNVNQLFKYIEEYRDALKDSINQDSNVKLMTFHSSKGLEFNDVIIIDTNDLIIPHKKSIKQKDIETERRLFYVALTRAKNNLYILYTKNRNGKTYKLSRFVVEGMKGVKYGK